MVKGSAMSNMRLTTTHLRVPPRRSAARHAAAWSPVTPLALPSGPSASHSHTITSQDRQARSVGPSPCIPYTSAGHRLFDSGSGFQSPIPVASD